MKLGGISLNTMLCDTVMELNSGINCTKEFELS